MFHLHTVHGCGIIVKQKTRKETQLVKYYRLAQVPNTLPLHWAYSDAWEYDTHTRQWIDSRNEGFQVFGSIVDVFRAAMGEDMDGSYSASEYPQLLEIDCDEDYVTDGCSLYFAVAVEGVQAVKAVSTDEFLVAVQSLFEKEKDQYDYEDVLDWSKDSEDQLTEIFNKLAVGVAVTYIETLEKPPVLELV